MSSRDLSTAVEDNQPPPFLRSWRRIYAVLVGELLVITALLYGLSRWLS